jgi:hypothetical protein
VDSSVTVFNAFESVRYQRNWVLSVGGVVVTEFLSCYVRKKAGIVGPLSVHVVAQFSHAIVTTCSNAVLDGSDTTSTCCRV